MICDRCKKSEATIHLTEIIKEIHSEVHICEKCANDIGLSSKISEFPKPLNDVVSFINFQKDSGVVDSYICKTCGTTFFEYRKTGKMGCSNCYIDLHEPMEPVINALLGHYEYFGKRPKYNSAIDTNIDRVKDELSLEIQMDLKDELDRALIEERYEDAAVYRDKINKGSE